MIKYLFIPIELENLLFAFQNIWIANGGYMIVTGVYKNDSVFIEGNTTIKTQTNDLIPKSIQDTFTNNIKKLVGFCVEAQQKDLPNELPSQIIIFDTASDYIEYENKI